MSFYRWIVEHPVAVWMITIAAMVFGLVSFERLPLNLMPDLSYPTLTIRTEYPGAAPEEVEQQVSRPIEEALSTVEGLVSIESHSRAGVSDVVLEFDWKTSMHGSGQNVREQLQSLSLGDGVQRPLLLRYDPSLDPILRIALSADGKKSETEMRLFAENELKRQLESVDGVAAVLVRGGLERRVLVEPREDWLAARGVTLPQLTNALQAGNVNMAGGVVREGENEYLIRTLNEVRSAAEVGALLIPRMDQQSVTVSDVATVREGTADREVVVRLDGTDAVELQVFKEADANLVTASRQVKQALDHWKLPDGMRYQVLDDQAGFVEKALSNLVSDSIVGGILCILITFLFLRDWVTTLIISTAIPICLIVTFAVMNLGGISLNLMSLGGLSLGVSMVVDSGTVVLESVQRQLDAGVPRREAAVKGTAEVATAVFASVLTSIAVFFPIVFVQGVAGQIFGDLAMAVVFSLATSLLVALVFIPMLAARELDLEKPPTLRELAPFSLGPAWAEFRESLRGWMAPLRFPWALLRLLVRGTLEFSRWILVAGSAFGLRLLLQGIWVVLRALNHFSLWFADVFLRGYGWSEGHFARWLLAALRRPGRILLGGVALLIFSALLFEKVGAELIPTVHQGRFTVEIALPVGTPLAVTDATLLQVEREIQSLSEVTSVYSVVGTEGGADARADEGENTARVLVEMRPGGDLDRREARLMEAIREQLSGWPQMQVHFRLPALFSFHTPLEVVVYDPDLERLKTASAEARAVMRSVPGLEDVRSSLSRGYPEIRVRYDRERLSRLGLTVGDVARTVRDKVQGDIPTRIHQGDKRMDLLLRLDPRDRSDREALAAINVNPLLQPPIRLDTVAELEEGEGPSEIRRVDQRRAVVLSAALAGFDLSGAAAEVRTAMERAGLGVEFEVAGQSRELDASISSLELALGLAIFLVYVIMASTFESLRDPLVILFSVPLALVGVSLGLWLTGNPVSVMVFLGMIVLAGVVVANAIVLVDAIQRLRSEGVALADAIPAAAAERLRPILITALNSVLGLLPLAMGFGEGAEIQRPMAVTVIFGLASSTFLTLVVVPVVYQVAARLTERNAG